MIMYKNHFSMNDAANITENITVSNFTLCCHSYYN